MMAAKSLLTRAAHGRLTGQKRTPAQPYLEIRQAGVLTEKVSSPMARDASSRFELPWIDPYAPDFLDQFIALPRHERAGDVYPLKNFDRDHLEMIALEALWIETPDRYFGVGGDRYRPLAYLDKRSWWEWHWIRGLNPGEPRPSIPGWLRKAVIARDGYVCQLCGDEVEPSDVHIDHIHPWSKGGNHTLDNLQVTHSRCNIRKGARV